MQNQTPLAESEIIPLPPSTLFPASEGNSALAIPVNIVPAVYAEPLKLGLERAHAFVITDADSYRDACDLFNMLNKFDKTIEELFLGAGRPFRERAKMITDEGTAYRAPIAPAKISIQAKIKKYKADEDAKIAAALEAQRQEALRVEAERQAAEAERLRLENEAKAKEELAARKLENADTMSAAQLRKAIKEGEEAQALRAQAAAIPAPSSIPFVAQDPVPVATKAKGVKMIKKVVLRLPLDFDPRKLPAAYLEINETKLKKAISDGLVEQGQFGVFFSIEEDLAPTGR